MSTPRTRPTPRSLQQLLLLALLLCCLGLPLTAEPAPRTLPELKAALETVLRETHTPGAAVAIVGRQGPEWIAGVGLADVATGTPATENTLFRVGSLSKGFVALSLLKLQHEGKLDLQDPLRKHLPDLDFKNPWEATHPVRLLHLLEHGAGWDDLALRDNLFVTPAEMSLREILDHDTRPLVSSWKPGSGYRYSSIGTVAAAHVVEKVTGQRFEDYVRRTWFNPLGMHGADYFNTAQVQSRLTSLYREDGVTPVPYWHFLVRPAGAINASARDMANYLGFLLKRGTFEGSPLLPAEALLSMETPAGSLAARSGMRDGYALASQTLVRGDRSFQGHHGSVVHGRAQLAYLPAEGVGFVFMTNSGSGWASSRIEALLRDYITRDLPKPAAPATATVPAQLLKEYEGWYEPVCPPNQDIAGLWRLMCLTELRPGNNGLWLRNFVGPMRAFNEYTAVTERQYRRPWERAPTLALIPDTGEGPQLQVNLHDHFHVMKRIPAALVWTELAVLLALLLLLSSNLAFPLLWLPLLLLRRKLPAEGLALRLLPLLATLSFLGTAYSLLSAQADPFTRLGTPTAWSLSLFALSLLFGACSVAGLVLALRRWGRPGNPLALWHSRASSLVFTVVTLYLAWWGLLGWRTWA